MDAAELTVAILGFLFAAVNFAATSIVFQLTRTWRNVHSNYRFITYSFILAMYGMAVGELCVSLRLFIDSSCGPMIVAAPMYNSCAIFVRYCRMLLLHSQLLLTTTMVGACIERTMATLRADYEQKETWQLGALILLLTNGVTLFWGALYWNGIIYPITQCLLTIAINASSTTYTFVLRRFNHRIYEVKRSADLSKRYQIHENVRVLGYILPWMTVTSLSLFLILASVLSLGQLFGLARISLHYCYVALNFYGASSTLFFLVYLRFRKNSTARKKTVLPKNSEMDEHFKLLEKFWKRN